MLSLRHRSASGDLLRMWEFDPIRSAIEIVFRLGSAAPTAVTVLVCHPAKPRLLAHPIARLNGEGWQVMPALYLPSVSVSRDRDRSRLMLRDCVERGQSLRDAVPCSLHAAMGRPGYLSLSNAPEDVSAELEALGA